MADLEDLDRRLIDVEGLVTDLPEMINLRFERIVTTLSEVTAGLNIADKQTATLTRDVRDLRGAVTRQLLAQDERLTAMEAKLTKMGAQQTTIEAKIDQILAVVQPMS
ncbi:MAG: hypothetical protein AB7O43_05410 [Hyphomicrobiaceae bacterium]